MLNIKYHFSFLLLVTCFANNVGHADVGISNIAYIAYSDGFWQLWTMDDNGKNQKQITSIKYDISRVSWFPDKKHILINGTQGQLAKVALSTGKTTAIELALKGSTDAVLSPNGKQIAFSVSTAEGIDTNDIWLADADGSNLQKLTRMAYLQHDPVWNLSGDTLYFLAGDGQQSHNIFKLDLKTLSVEQLTVGQLYHFDLSVNSKNELAFSSNRDGNYEIFYNNNKGKSTRLTNHPALDARPAWSPTMKKIVFESTRAGSPNLWVLDLKSQQLTQLTSYPRGARSPVWFQNTAYVEDNN